MSRLNRFGMRADTTHVAEILSDAYAKPITAPAEEEPTRITPKHIDRMGKTTSILQVVHWEMYEGGFGTQTLLKRTESNTMTCPECDTEGRYDENSEVVCDNDECAVVLSDDGEMEYIQYPDTPCHQDGTTGEWSSSNMSRGVDNRGPSGDPHFRPPAISAAGPSGDDRL